MTLPPSRLGDKGQRFLIQTQNYPVADGGWQNAAYSNKECIAESMANSLRLAPTCTDVRIIDREKTS